MTGLSFSLAVIGFVIVSGAIGLAVAHALRRMDEIEEEQHRRAEALRALDLPDVQPPYCLRELDPNFVNAEERGWLS